MDLKGHKYRIETVIEEIQKDMDNEESFYVTDLDAVRSQVRKWESLIPDADIFYAVKANNTSEIIQEIANLDCGFACSRVSEIQCVLNNGISGEKITFVKPIKSAKDIKFAAEHGILKITVESPDELQEIKEHFPQSEILLHIAPVHNGLSRAFVSKFGLQEGEWEVMLEKARDLELNVVGVRFHMGSRCGRSTDYVDTFAKANTIFQIADQMGISMHVIDFGGGFSGSRFEQHQIPFTKLARVLTGCISQLPDDIRIIGEPGRFLVSNSTTLATKVVARKMAARLNMNRVSYFVNDGVQNNFSQIPLLNRTWFALSVLKNGNKVIFDEVAPTDHKRKKYRKRVLSTIWGQSALTEDCLLADIHLPLFGVGDWILFHNMGAYTKNSRGDQAKYIVFDSKHDHRPIREEEFGRHSGEFHLPKI